MKAVVIVLVVVALSALLTYVFYPYVGRVISGFRELMISKLMNGIDATDYFHEYVINLNNLMNSSFINKLLSELNSSVKFVIASSDFLINYVKYGNVSRVCTLVNTYSIPCNVISSLVINGTPYSRLVATSILAAIVDSLRYNYSLATSLALIKDQRLDLVTTDLSKSVGINELMKLLSEWSANEPLVIIRASPRDIGLISNYLHKLLRVVKGEVNLAIMYLNLSKSSDYDVLYKVIKVPLGINLSALRSASIVIIKNDEVLATLNLKKVSYEIVNSTSKFVVEVSSVVRSGSVKGINEVINKLLVASKSLGSD